MKKNAHQPLFSAAYHDDILTLRRLITSKANIFVYDENGYTLLHASAKGTGACARLLIQSGLDVNVRDKEGKTALHYVSSAQFIRTMVQLGADVNAQDNHGKTPLYEPLTLDDPQNAQLLIALGSDLQRRDDQGRTLLHQAALARSSTSLLLLIAYGANVDTQDNDGCTPLQSVENDDYESKIDPVEVASPEEVLRLLREAYQGVHLWDENDNTALILTAAYDVVEALPKLLERGADLLATGYNWDHSHRWNALQHAVAENALEAATYLRPLMPLEGIWTAIAHGDSSAVLAALDQGLDINTQDAQDMTPLMAAAMYGQTEIVRLLIARGANPYYVDLGGCNALIWTRDPQIAALLLDHDVEIDRPSYRYWTPLLAAVQFRRKDMVAFLLERGADIAMKHRDDLSALRLAYALGDQEIAALLEQYKATNKNSQW